MNRKLAFGEDARVVIQRLKETTTVLDTFTLLNNDTEVFLWFFSGDVHLERNAMMT